MLPTPELEIARNLPTQGCSAEEAQRYTRWLATHHYENFGVVSWLLPRELHQHFYNVYAYCRWSDDLGDEIPDSARALELLNAWEEDLRHCWRHGEEPRHPVVVVGLKRVARGEDANRYPPESPRSHFAKRYYRLLGIRGLKERESVIRWERIRNLSRG